jgi:hypothetical protein
MYTIIWECKNS